MARQVLLFLLVAFLNVSLILCREDYQHHISDSFSHHHRRSTPEDSVVSTKDPLSVTEGEGKPLGEIQHGYPWDDDFDDNDDFDVRDDKIVTVTYNRSSPAATIASVIISIISLIIGLVIIFVCGKKIGRKVRTGYVVNKTEGTTGGQPQLSPSTTFQKTDQKVELQNIPLSTPQLYPSSEMQSATQ